MRDKIINHITGFLDSFTKCFHSEEEVQLLIAQHLINTKAFGDVYVEYYLNRLLIPDYPWSNKKLSVDIVVRNNNDYIPIEIKFKTKKQVFPYSVFGSETNVELADQSAQNEGCYSFWKDLKRLEIIRETFQLKYSGILIFITNDSSYLKHPRQDVQYEPFSIHQGRQVNKGEFLNWNSTKKPITIERAAKFPGFTISNSYAITWKDMLIENHKYILL